MTITINQQPVKHFIFNGGECQVTLPDLDFPPQVEVHAKIYSSDDVMCLLLSIDALRRIHPEVIIHLVIPYFPYARQDRVCSPGEALSVKVMADLINSLNCVSVTIYDPHSDVTPALIKNCIVKSSADIIAHSILSTIIANKNLTLVSPDAGAEKKVHAVAKRLASRGVNVSIACASKVREPHTGKITETRLIDEVYGRDYIIIDDICDGGRTFIELAKVMRQQDVRQLYLYVTHGLFSKGLEVFKEHFTHVYCYQTPLPYDKFDNNYLTIIEENRHEH